MTVHYSFDFAQQVCLYMQVVYIKLYRLGPLPQQPGAARTYIFPHSKEMRIVWNML